MQRGKGDDKEKEQEKNEEKAKQEEQASRFQRAYESYENKKHEFDVWKETRKPFKISEEDLDSATDTSSSDYMSEDEFAELLESDESLTQKELNDLLSMYAITQEEYPDLNIEQLQTLVSVYKDLYGHLPSDDDEKMMRKQAAAYIFHNIMQKYPALRVSEIKEVLDMTRARSKLYSPANLKTDLAKINKYMLQHNPNFNQADLGQIFRTVHNKKSIGLMKLWIDVQKNFPTLRASEIRIMLAAVQMTNPQLTKVRDLGPEIKKFMAIKNYVQQSDPSFTIQDVTGVWATYKANPHESIQDLMAMHRLEMTGKLNSPEKEKDVEYWPGKDSVASAGQSQSMHKPDVESTEKMKKMYETELNSMPHDVNIKGEEYQPKIDRNKGKEKNWGYEREKPQTTHKQNKAHSSVDEEKGKEKERSNSSSIVISRLNLSRTEKADKENKSAPSSPKVSSIRKQFESMSEKNVQLRQTPRSGLATPRTPVGSPGTLRHVAAKGAHSGFEIWKKREDSLRDVDTKPKPGTPRNVDVVKNEGPGPKKK